MSCYAPGRQATPHIDSLTQGGTLFSQASSPYPLTLPAHAALFTSRYAFSNGVEDNGVPLGPAATIATAMQKAGYRTAAFVGSFVLDRRFGLNQGFDVYDGPVDKHNQAEGPERKRPGAQVLVAAEKWLERNGAAPFFLFLHLYDLHLPYDLPREPAHRHGPAGYTAELAYVDGLIGEFTAALDRRGLMRKALVVFTSDHGEGLGDHQESTHGYFVYQATLHVPLIVHWPAGRAGTAARRVDEPVSLLDVAPTILQAAGVPAPAEMRGRNLAGEAKPAPVYSESVYARNHFGCAALEALRAGRYKYIEAPKPELYDLESDPGETRNLYAQQRDRAAAMSRQIAAIRAAEQAASRRPAQSARALRSLGYLAGSASGVHSRIDPKDRAAQFEQYLAALSWSSEGKLGQADAALEKLRDQLPDVPDIRVSLGLNQQRLGQFDRAQREFARAVALDPNDAQAHFELGFCDFHLRKAADAVREFDAALAIEPWYTRADEALAELYLQQKDLARARERLNHLLAVDPESYAAHYNLGVFAALDQNWRDAEQHLAAAIRADPASAEAHDALGGVYLQTGDLARARQEFQEAIRRQPAFGPAHDHLRMIAQQENAR